MISAKPVVVVAVLALAGSAVAQEQANAQEQASERSALPSAMELLREVSRQRPQANNLASTIEILSVLDVKLQAELAKLDETRRLRLLRARESSWWAGLWHQSLNIVAWDYKSIRNDDANVPLAMMQLLLLSHMPCSDVGYSLARFGKYQALSQHGYADLADALLLAAETPRESALGHLHKLHHGDERARIRAAIFLGQQQELAPDIVPHLVEELSNDNTRVVQEAITALGMLGPAARDALPTLEKLTEHEDRQIAERAKAALRQIRSPRNA